MSWSLQWQQLHVLQYLLVARSRVRTQGPELACELQQNVWHVHVAQWLVRSHHLSRGIAACVRRAVVLHQLQRSVCLTLGLLGQQRRPAPLNLNVHPVQISYVQRISRARAACKART